MPLDPLRPTIAVVGILLPYLARLPKGVEWVQQYTHAGLPGNLLLGALNAIPWGCMIAASLAFRNRKLVLIPCTLGFGVLAWEHHTLDLASNANAPIGLAIIPFYATVAVGIGTALGLAVDRLATRRDA